MNSVNQEITDLKGEFEGGKSFAIDWYQKLRLTARTLLEQINPDTLKREVPIYGGLTRSLQVYYCPSDVRVPTRLYDKDDRRVMFDFVPARYFYDHPDRRNIFTLEYVNGVRFIVLHHPTTSAIAEIDPMNDPTETFTGVTLAKNTYNYLPGAVASLQGKFSDTVYTIGRSITGQSLDISSLLRGVAIVPLYVDSGGNVAQVTLKLKTDDNNYYTVTSTQDSIGSYLRDGQNMVRFWMNNATITGTPVPSTINSWELQVQMKTGVTQTVIIGRMTVQQSHLFVFEYQSNYVFIDKTTGAWKDTPASGDFINLEDPAMSVFHYEACRKVIQGAKTERVNSSESQRIDTDLARAYGSYYAIYPSAAEPLSYSVMPEIPYSPDPFFEYGFGALPERIGNSTDAVQPFDSTFFADAEIPSGIFDGTNATFHLAHTPSPVGSLQVIINGEVLAEGVGYTIAGSVLTLLTPYYTAPFIGLPFYVNYRYSS